MTFQTYSHNILITSFLCWWWLSSFASPLIELFEIIWIVGKLNHSTCWAMISTLAQISKRRFNSIMLSIGKVALFRNPPEIFILFVTFDNYGMVKTPWCGCLNPPQFSIFVHLLKFSVSGSLARTPWKSSYRLLWIRRKLHSTWFFSLKISMLCPIFYILVQSQKTWTRFISTRIRRLILFENSMNDPLDSFSFVKVTFS